MERSEGSGQNNEEAEGPEERLAALLEQLQVETAEKDRQAALAAEYVGIAKRA